MSERGGGCRARYAAAQTASASLASSDGWKAAGPSGSQRRAPFTDGPDREHGEQEAERDEHEQPARAARSRRKSQRCPTTISTIPSERVERLALDVVVRVAAADGGGRRGRRVDADDPERDQRQRDEDQNSRLELSPAHRDGFARESANPG